LDWDRITPFAEPREQKVTEGSIRFSLGFD
jgi:hypothetical protein